MRIKKSSLHHPSRSPGSISLRLERWHRYWMYGVFALLTLSGLAWLVAHYFMQDAGGFGLSPLEGWSMKLHGAAAMGMFFFTGSIMNSHIRRALKTQRNLVSGWAMIFVLTLLALSGYALYYLASESSRPLWSLFHWMGGLVFAVLAILHILLGRRSRREDA